MADFFIRINRNSVKKNPEAGSTAHLVPGPTFRTPDGMHRNVQIIRSLIPEPQYLWEFENTQIKCPKCGAEFSYRALEMETESDDNGDDYCINICPKCGEAGFYLEFEKINDVLKELNLT